MGWFTRWFGTRYYSLLYGHRDAGEALAWVEAILGRWELGVGAEVLDLACGRGRHTRLFADRGMKMTGVDISRTSIEEARKQVPEASLFVHDMREPLAENAFDAACCLFTSLGYFDDREDDHRVFRAVFGCLRPGGRFVVDFMNTERVLRELVPEEKLVREGVTFEITRRTDNGVLVKHIHVMDGDDEHDFEERVQTLTPEELEEMARNAGFEVLERTDGPVLEPYDPERAERYVLWLRRPDQ